MIDRVGEVHAERRSLDRLPDDPRFRPGLRKTPSEKRNSPLRLESLVRDGSIRRQPVSLEARMRKVRFQRDCRCLTEWREADSLAAVDNERIRQLSIHPVMSRVLRVSEVPRNVVLSF